MSILPILTYGDYRLREKAVPVQEITPDLLERIDDMIATLKDADGIGLAATQVGIMRRFFVIDLGLIDANMSPVAFINPEITSQEGEEILEEGCLSIPGFREDVPRPSRITLSYKDINNTQHDIECTGLLARVVCHETDHLNGLLFIDHISPLRRKLLASKLRQLSKEAKAI